MPPSLRAGAGPFYSQRLDWSPCQESFLCAEADGPLDYRHPGGPPSTWPCSGAGRGPAAPHRVAGREPRWSWVPGTSSRRGGQADRWCAPARAVRHRRPRPARDRRSDPVDCLSDAEFDDYVAATDPDTLPRACLPGLAHGVRRGLRRAVRRAGRPRLDGRGGPGPRRAAGGTGGVEADLPRRVVRHPAGRDVRRAVPGPGRAAGPRRRRGPVRDHREMALDQARGFETALRAYVQNCVDSTDSCFLGSPWTRGWAGSSGSSTRSTHVRCRRRRTRPRGGQRLLRDRPPALQPGLLDRAQPGPAERFDGDGTTLLRLSDAYTLAHGGRRVRRQPARGVLRRQLPRRPVGDRAVGGGRAARRRSSRRPHLRPVVRLGLTSCLGFEARAAERLGEVRAAGAPPIVVIGTTRDPATPMKWAEALADQLESGVLIRRDGDGHTGYHAGNAASTRRSRTTSSTAPSPPTACPADLSLVHASARGGQARRSPGCAGWRARSSAGPRGTGWRRRGARSPACRTARSHRHPAGVRGQAGQQLLGRAARDDGVGQPHADQLDRSLDVLDLDPRLGLRPVSCSIWRSTVRVESVARQVVSGITSDAWASRCG